MRAEDQIIHHLKDKVGLTGADTLVAQLKREQRDEVLNKAADAVHEKANSLDAALGRYTETAATMRMVSQELRDMAGGEA